MVLQPPSYPWVYSALAVLLLSTWSSGSDEPLEFTVEVFPVTEEPSTPSALDPTHKSVELSSVITDPTTTSTTTPSMTTTPTTTSTEDSTTSTTASTTTTTTATNTTISTTTETTTPTTTPTVTSTTPPTTTPTTTPTTIPATTPTTTPVSTTEDPGHCSADPYCDGSLFPAQFYLSGHKIVCDQQPSPSQHCCLPQGKHLVCYNIMVDGEYLSFAADRPGISTDYMELCDLLVLHQNATSGPYSTISKVKGSGRVAYRYKEWVTLHHTLYRVKDIACMIIEQKKEPRKASSNRTKTGREDNKTKKENATAEVEPNKLDVED